MMIKRPESIGEAWRIMIQQENAIAAYKTRIAELESALLETFDEYNETGDLSTVLCLKAAAMVREVIE